MNVSGARNQQNKVWSSRANFFASLISMLSTPVLTLGLIFIFLNKDFYISYPHIFLEILFIIFFLPFCIYLFQAKGDYFGMNSRIFTRHERNVMYFGIIISFLLLIGLNQIITSSSDEIKNTGIIFSIYFGLFFIFNMIFDKVSMHTGSFVFSTMLFASLTHYTFLIILPLLPVVIWARVTLKKHTFAELILGTLIGTISAFAAINLII